MSRREIAWFAAMALLTLLVAASAPAFPMDQAEEHAADEGQDTATVERILREQEDLLRGQRTAYDPEGRRDPFVSLFEIMSRVPDGPRPKGIAGMLVSEVDLDGIVEDMGAGDLAFFTGSDNKGYFLRVGDGVFDGTLISIDPRKGAVTFRQEVDDPRMIKPFRDVTKRLVPLDEESKQ